MQTVSSFANFYAAGSVVFQPCFLSLWVVLWSAIFRSCKFSGPRIQSIFGSVTDPIISLLILYACSSCYCWVGSLSDRCTAQVAKSCTLILIRALFTYVYPIHLKQPTVAWLYKMYRLATIQRHRQTDRHQRAPQQTFFVGQIPPYNSSPPLHFPLPFTIHYKFLTWPK